MPYKLKNISFRRSVILPSSGSKQSSKRA